MDNLDNIITKIYNDFNTGRPEEIKTRKSSNLIKKEMKNRIINMNRKTEELKNKPFKYWDNFFGI